MALEKNDLKQIREIVREEVYDQINAEVPPIVEAKIAPLRSDIKIIREKLEQIWKSETEDITATVELIDKLKSELKNLKIRVERLEKQQAR